MLIKPSSRTSSTPSTASWWTRLRPRGSHGAAEIKGDDCTLVLERPDQTTAKVRLHDAYRDPKLTDCGAELSKAGWRRVTTAVFKAGVGDVLNIATSPRDGAARLPRRRGARGAVPGRARAQIPKSSSTTSRARWTARLSCRRRRAQFKRLGSIFVVFGRRSLPLNSLGLIKRGRPAARSQGRWRRRGRRLRRGPRRLPPGGLWFR